jgi:putative endonuclease
MFGHIEGNHSYYVYIITNKYRSKFYVGMTNDLSRRLKEHKQNIENGVLTFA